MVIQLDPRYPVVWRDPYCMQVGVDIALCTLPAASRATQRMMAALAVGIPRSGLTMIARSSGEGDADVAALLEEIRPALRQDDERSAPRARIAIDGDGATGRLLAQLLATEGIDAVDLTDGVDADTVAVDAAVIIARFAITPARHGAWLRRDIPHLPVIFGDRVIRIGPLVEPGAGPCLHCVDLAHVDADHAWPAMATQLVGKSAAAETPSASMDAAVRVTRWLRDWLATGRSPRPATSIRVDASSGRVSLQKHGWHERCGCRALSENATPVEHRIDRLPGPPSSDEAPVALG
jgi:hypothetical protein